MVSFISSSGNQEDLHGNNSPCFLLLQTQVKIKAATNDDETIPSAMDNIIFDLICVRPVARIYNDK